MKKHLSRKTISMIFTVAAVIGVGVSNVITAIRTKKYQQMLEECNGNCIKATIKTYWPSIAAAAATCGSIIFAEGVNLKELALASGTCGFLATKLKKTEEAVENYGGEELLQKVKAESTNEAAAEQITYVCHGGPSIEETGRGDLLCLENFGGRTFRSSETNVIEAVDCAQQMIGECNDFFFNYLYELLGISWSDFGRRFGFPGDEGYADAKMFDTTYYDTGEFCMGPGQYNAEPILVIDVLETPDYMYLEDGL